MIGSIGGIDLKREKVRELQLRAAGILLAGSVVFLLAGPGLPGAGQTIYAEESAEDKAVDNTEENAEDESEDKTGGWYGGEHHT